MNSTRLDSKKPLKGKAASKRFGSTKRWRHARPVSKALPALTDKTLRRQGFAVGALARQWKVIVGDELAMDCMPMKLGFPRNSAGDGQLTLRVVSAAAAVRIQHLDLMIMQRVNRFLGYQAVARVKLVQGPFASHHAQKKPLFRDMKPLGEKGQQRLDDLVNPDEKSNLNDALRRLGTAILSEEKST